MLFDVGLFCKVYFREKIFNVGLFYKVYFKARIVWIVLILSQTVVKFITVIVI